MSFTSVCKLVCIAGLLCASFTTSHAKPFIDLTEVNQNDNYKDTEEILNEWDNEESYYYEDEQPKGPVIQHLPPVLVALEIPETTPTPTTTSTTTTSTTTTSRPVYFPNTKIELGPLFEQVGMARRKERVEPVDLPVPYIVWARDSESSNDHPSKTESNRRNYWKRVYNTAYTIVE